MTEGEFQTWRIAEGYKWFGSGLYVRYMEHDDTVHLCQVVRTNLGIVVNLMWMKYSHLDRLQHRVNSMKYE